MRSLKKVASVGLVVLAMLTVTAASSEARARNGGGFSGHHAARFERDRGRVEHHERFAGHRGFHGRVFIGAAPFVIGGPTYAYDAYASAYPPPVYTPAPSTWYFCQSAGAYYPNVTTCAEGWVPVPAQ